MRTAIFYLSILLIFSCGSSRRSQGIIETTTAPLVNVPGCVPGINTLRARDARITSDKNSQLKLAAALEAAAKSDVNITDSLLKSGVTAAVSGALSDTLKSYFVLDQSFSNDIWEQTNAFSLTICMIKTLRDDQNSSPGFKADMERRLSSMLESQEGYIFNRKKKVQQ